jgi:hypothetical protein
MLDEREMSSEDVAIALGHQDGGNLVRRLYGHRDKETRAARSTGHADHATTLIYAGYSPRGHELDMIERAFARGSNPCSNPSGEIASRRDGIAPEQ